jgi:hypothetical protein
LIMKADGDAHGRGATGLYGREFRRWGCSFFSGSVGPFWTRRC